MGVGWALTEHYESNATRVVTDSLVKLGVPFVSEAPEVDAVIVEVGDPDGPYGAKGMGEVGLNPVAPAISNAIFDAVGVRMHDVPMTPSKVLAALAGGSL
jgi:CO/xanthine dehydrogenase Mo-binding subunit